MRNVFDQYSQPENRLTHALGVCLNEDRALLREFLAWIDVRPPKSPHALLVEEQRLPGDEDERDSRGEVTDEREAERRGRPDLVIHGGAARVAPSGGDEVQPATRAPSRTSGQIRAKGRGAPLRWP
jgi:hypothetical protein